MCSIAKPLDGSGRIRQALEEHTAKESHSQLTKALVLQKGRKPLHYASEIGQIEVTVALLEAKACVAGTSAIPQMKS